MTKFESLCDEYRENKRLIEELEAMNDGLKASIIELMNGQDVVTEGATKVCYKLVSSTRFDSNTFKKVYPDLYMEYSTPTAYRRFTVQ